MKKFVLILAISWMLNGCFCSKKQQEFINPVFNNLLYAYGRTSWNTLLTPDSISESPDDFSISDAYIETHHCELIENEHKHIKYICNMCYPDILKDNKLDCSFKTIVYQITDDGFIEKKSFEPNHNYPYSIQHLIIKK